MKNSIKIAIGILIAAAVLFGAFRLTGNTVSNSENYDELAKCLTASGAKMYGAYWCSHCQNQKAMFGDSFQYISYVECDAKGENGNPTACQAAGIEGYPTWVFGNGEKVPGEMSFEELAQKTGCTLPD